MSDECIKNNTFPHVWVRFHEGVFRTGMLAKKGNHGVNNYQSLKLQNDCNGTCWRPFAQTILWGFCSARYFITMVDLYGMNVGKYTVRPMDPSWVLLLIAIHCERPQGIDYFSAWNAWIFLVRCLERSDPKIWHHKWWWQMAMIESHGIESMKKQDGPLPVINRVITPINGLIIR